MEVLEVPEIMRCVLHRMLEAADGRFCCWRMLEVLEMPEVMHCLLLRMLEAVEVGSVCWKCRR